MLEFITNLFNNASSLLDLGRRQVTEAIEPVVSKKKSIAIPESELQVLAREFGELRPGKTIEITLRDLLKLIPRQRHKSDAYRTLRSELRKRGVALCITPQNKHLNNYHRYGK